jgi:hypothetical protein
MKKSFVISTNKKKSRLDKQIKKSRFGPREPRPHGLPKGPWGCPLDHRYLPIWALRPNFDLFSIHIGRSSNIRPIKVAKNRYYSGYYGTTMVVPTQGEQVNRNSCNSINTPA